MPKLHTILPVLAGLLVLSAVMSLAELGLIPLPGTTIENSLVAIFAGLTTTLIGDSFVRNQQIREILRNVLATHLSDSAKVYVFSNADEAYEYLHRNIRKTNSIKNTIVHNDAYTERGIKPKSKYSELYNKEKHRLISKGLVYCEDIISPSYKGYADFIFNNVFSVGRSKYSAFIMRTKIDAFQNFIILEYESGYFEVIIGWIITYDTSASGQKCFLISNQEIVKHYLDYFSAIRDNNCKRYSST